MKVEYDPTRERVYINMGNREYSIDPESAKWLKDAMTQIVLVIAKRENGLPSWISEKRIIEQKDE